MASRDGAVILVISTVFLVTTLSLTLASPKRINELQPRQQAIQDCTTNLARDLYGLGVRLGVYFQWFSAYVSNNFIVDEINGGLDANAIFLFALLISIVRSTRTEDMALMDGLIMLLLCAGTMWSVLSLWGYRTCVYRKEGPDAIRRFGGFGTHLRLLEGAGVSWYAIWYWTVGVKGLPQGLPEFGDMTGQNCDKKEVVLFGQHISGIASNAALAVSGVSLAYSALITLAAPIAAITRAKKMWHFFRNKQYASSSRLRYATGLNHRQLIIVSRVFCVFNLCWIFFAMLTIEIALNENAAIGVLGAEKASYNGQILQPAQLLPMLIGAFSFARILFIAYELWRNPQGDITPSLGRQASKRYTRAKRDPATGLNIFKMFSQAAADTAEEEETGESHRKWNDDAHNDSYYDLASRLNIWQRILVTWMPWVSLFWFWPWSKDIDSPNSQAEDTMRLQPRNEPMSLQTPHRTRFIAFEDEVERESIETGYHRPSHVSAAEDDEPQKPNAMI